MVEPEAGLGRSRSTPWAMFAAVAVPQLVLAALTWPLFSRGLSSLDANGIIRSTLLLVDHGQLWISRPPGHPTVEFLFLPLITQFVRSVFGGDLDARTYLIHLYVVGAAALGAFSLLLRKFHAPPVLVFLGSLFLLLSPPFIEQAAEGEETLWALLLLLLAVHLTLPEGAATPRHWIGRLLVGATLFGLAAGARPEVVFVLPAFLVILWLSRKKFADPIIFLGMFFLTVAVLWSPIIMTGQPLTPYSLSQSTAQLILESGYKHLFTVLPFPASLIAWGGAMVVAFRRRREIMHQPRRYLPQIFALLGAFIPALIFFRYPTKDAFCIPCMVSLGLLLALWQQTRLLALLCVIELAGLFIQVDIFKERQLTAPHLRAGTWVALAEEKPLSRLGELNRAGQLGDKTPALVIVNFNSFELAWLSGQTNARLVQESETIGGEKFAFYVPLDHSQTKLVSRDFTENTSMLLNERASGAEIYLDETIYHAFVKRYELTWTKQDFVEIGPADNPIRVQTVELNQP